MPHSTTHALLLFPLFVQAGTPSLARSILTPAPRYPLPTIPCTLGDDSPCTDPGSWRCTPTMPCTTGQPSCGGLCISIWTPTPCMMGNDEPCMPTGICTPTMSSSPGLPWSKHETLYELPSEGSLNVFVGGQCIETPPPVTTCTMGDDKPCLPSSHCTPTMISTPRLPWGKPKTRYNIPLKTLSDHFPRRTMY
jgi:hypothetical protein